VQVEEVGETVGGYGERQSQVRVGVDRTALGRTRLDSAIIERRDAENTPVLVPAILSGAIPASSTAS
jgi:hypothetical protein